MYNAPAVTYPVGRSLFQAGLILAVLLAGAAAQGAWWWLSAKHGVVHGLGWLLWLVFGAWAVWRGVHLQQAQLAWDGRDWRLQAGASSPPVRPQVILDVQHHLLLCLRPETGFAVWVWPAQGTQPERWLALRRALFHPASHPESTGLAASPEV
jgi:hypothetical protein